MIISFSKKEKSKIKSKKKIHAIIVDDKNEWEVGKQIHMATGIRQKNYNCFNDKHFCKSIQSIKIKHKDTHLVDYSLVYIYVDDKPIYTDNIERLVKNEGFESKEDFFDKYNKNLEGKIIHWTRCKY